MTTKDRALIKCLASELYLDLIDASKRLRFDELNKTNKFLTITTLKTFISNVQKNVTKLEKTIGKMSKVDLESGDVPTKPAAVVANFLRLRPETMIASQHINHLNVFANNQVTTEELIRRELATTTIVINNEIHKAKNDRLIVSMLASHLIQVLDPLITELKKLKKNKKEADETEDKTAAEKRKKGLAKDFVAAEEECTICGRRPSGGWTSLPRFVLNKLLDGHECRCVAVCESETAKNQLEEAMIKVRQENMANFFISTFTCPPLYFSCQIRCLP